MHPALAGLIDLLSGQGTLLALAAGSLAGVVAGLMPGVSGRSALLIALPFVLGLPPIAAAVLLIALHASSQISGTVPAALIGAPTSASEAATAIDGYPLSVRGDGGRVIGAVISSSALGGVAGALILLLLAPFGARLVLSAGTPEIAAFAAVGIIAIAAVSSSGAAIGIVIGAAGALASTVGFDNMTAIPRFTFGNNHLLNGFSTPAVVAGLIAIPELLVRLDRTATTPLISATVRQTLGGLVEPIRHGWLSVRSTAIGFVVGLLPGLGTSVAVWLAYSHATRTSKPTVPFGQGAIEGVIAPECANGAKEGGAYFPTLLLGVPGSSGMAIMLGAFAVIGIRVGPGMFSATPQLPATVAFTVLLADLLAMLICLLAAPMMVRLASLNRRVVVAISLTAAVGAAYYALPQPGTSLEILGFGVLGVTLLSAGISRPPFLIGFIVGPILESALRRSSMIYGWSALQRPGVIVIGIVVATIIVFLLFRRKMAADPLMELKIGRGAMGPLIPAMIVFVAAIRLSVGFTDGASIMPILASSAGLLAAIWALLRRLVTKSPRQLQAPVHLNQPLALFLAAGLLLCEWTGPLGLVLPLASLALPLGVFSNQPAK